jgi:hypothetical protein
VTEDISTWPNESATWRTDDHPEWRKRVYDLGWRERRNEKGKIVEYLLFGPCPRCGHQMNVSAGIAGVLPGGQRQETVRCNCTGEHNGRPDGKTGCGQRGNVPIP